MKDLLLRAAGRVAARRTVTVEPNARLNIGSGPINTTEGWIHLDAGPHVLARHLPAPLLRLLLRLTQVGPEAATTLKTSRFVFHDVRHPLPFRDRTFDAVYSSHLLEHLTAEQGAFLLRETRRVLRPGGIIRILTPRQQGEWDGALSDEGFYDSHRCMYDAERLIAAVAEAGFRLPHETGHGEGECPDVETLDRRPGSLCVEATVT